MARPRELVTGKRRSYGAPPKEIGARDPRVTGGRPASRSENPRLPVRRRGRSMQRFGRMHGLQRIVASYSALTDHFDAARALGS